MSYHLAQPSFERLMSLIKEGKYVDKPWSFDAEDSNAILGDDSWVEYRKWFLGVEDGVAETSTDAGGKNFVKSNFEYPYGKGGDVYLSALRAIISRASQQGAADIADAAKKALDLANQKDADKAKASAPPMEIAATCDPNDANSLTLNVPLTIEASADGPDGKPSGPPKFSMVAYNGGPMALKGWQHPVVIDLKGMTGTEKSRPAFRDHNPGEEVGHTTSITNDGRTLHAEGVVSGVGPHVDRVTKSSKNGFPWQASVGAKVINNEFVPSGSSAMANGQSWNGPLNIARRTSLGEISFVALGADDSTSARIAAQAAKGTSMKFKAWAKAKGFADMDAEAIKCAKALFKATNPNSDPDDDSPDPEQDAKDAADKKKKADAAALLDLQAASGEGSDIPNAKEIAAQAIKEGREAIVKERKRMSDIQATLDKYKPRVEAAKFADIEAKAINDEWDLNKVELELIRAERPDIKAAAPSPFGINTGAGSDATMDIVAAACALQSGVSEKYALQGLNDQQKDIAATKVRKEFSSIYDICQFVAHSNGVRLKANRMTRDVLDTMQGIEVRASMDILAASGGTGSSATMSLSGITENILNKALLQGYGLVASAVPDIAWETDTNDFKTFKRYRLTQAGIMQALGAAGELKSISLQDESYSNQVKTQGVMLTIGRDILTNDDMGALTDSPTMLGRGAALYREMLVFQNWLNLPSTVAPGASTGQTANAFNFFSSGANNYLSGGSSALSITSLATAEQYFRQQTDANGMPVMLEPDRLLVSPQLSVTANNLFNGANLVVTSLASTSSKGVDPNVNAFKGKYRPIVSPFLSTVVATSIKTKLSTYPSGTDTGWALLTNPAGGFATLQVGYLRGQRTPIIERGESNFNTLGIALRCYYDFGVSAGDYRCGVYSAGA